MYVSLRDHDNHEIKVIAPCKIGHVYIRKEVGEAASDVIAPCKIGHVYISHHKNTPKTSINTGVRGFHFSQKTK